MRYRKHSMGRNSPRWSRGHAAVQLQSCKRCSNKIVASSLPWPASRTSGRGTPTQRKPAPPAPQTAQRCLARRVHPTRYITRATDAQTQTSLVRSIDAQKQTSLVRSMLRNKHHLCDRCSEINSMRYRKHSMGRNRQDSFVQDTSPNVYLMSDSV